MLACQPPVVALRPAAMARAGLPGLPCHEGAAPQARCQLISKLRTAVARDILLDSGGENAYVEPPHG